MANSAKRRSSKITAIPLATTIAAPMTSVAEGVADQKIQSMPKAHRIAVYSKGPTTEGGANPRSPKATANRRMPQAANR